MDRRTLLKALALTSLSPTLSGQLFAAPANGSKLLFVFLRGGYDSNHLLVPISSNYYYEARPSISIARPSDDPRSALALNSDWGLHPILRESIYPMYQRGEVAFIPFAGTNDTSRSHFETQDSIELGQPDQGTRNYRSGFLNRLAGVLTGSTPIAFTGNVPTIFQGSVDVPNIGMRSVAKPKLNEKQSEVIANMYKGTAYSKQVSDGFAVRDEVMQQMAGEMEAADRSAISAKGFELEARRIAKLMKERHNLGFVDVGGWDTHVGQGNANGTLASRFEELGRGLAAFSNEMGAEWKNTVVVVVSEFGRTFKENGNKGTDHGHGTVYWVLGGSIQGGKVLGEQQRFEANNLFQNRDTPVLNEYRSVLAGLFERMYRLNNKQLQQVFKDIKPRHIGLV